MAVVAGKELETIDRCELCGSARFRTIVSEPPYDVMRCSDCGLGWVTPRLPQEELTGIYTDATYWRSPSPRTQGYHDYRAEEERYLKTFRRRLEFVLREGPRGGKALDVGCAAGFAMQAVRELGFEPYGVEVSEEIARHATGRFGFNTIHLGPLETAPFEEGMFDFIMLWDVVEHVADPRSLLRTARHLLRPDGVLVIETQDIDSAFARLLRARWHHYKHQEHIFHFNASTITALLDQTGFSVRRITPRYAGKYVSLHFIAERAARLHPALSAMLRPLARLERVSLYCNVMDEIIVVARPWAESSA